MQHRTIRYCIQGKVRNQARMRDISSPIQPYHTLDFVFFSRGRRLRRWCSPPLWYVTWHAGKDKHTQRHQPKIMTKDKQKEIQGDGAKSENLLSVYLDHEELQTTDNFTYLGSKVCKDGGADVDIKNRVNKARGAFFRLKPVWRSTIYSRRTKLRLYQSCVLCTLLPGSQCWHVTKLDTFLPSTQNAFEYHENILATKKSQTTNC